MDYFCVRNNISGSSIRTTVISNITGGDWENATFKILRVGTKFLAKQPFLLYLDVI